MLIAAVSAVAGAIFAAADGASAAVPGKTEFVCLHPTGFAYYAASKTVTGADVGWAEDGITGGIIVVTLNPDGSSTPFSIYVTDVTGSTFNVSDEADLSATYIDAESGTLRFDAVYSACHSETYIITGGGTRNPSLLLTTVRADGPLPASKLFVAQCAAR